MSCLKGGFASLRYNQIRNITASLLKDICHNVRIEPRLQQLTSESFNERTTNEPDDARADVRAHSLWITSQTAFLMSGFLTQTNVKRYVSQ